jgi:hypothetical protein
MSDQMFGVPGKDPIKNNMSMLNSVDAAAMKGPMQQNIDNMSLGQFIESLGMDLEGPATQLVEFGKKQAENGSMPGKMKNIGGGVPGSGSPVPPTTPPAQQGGTMADLIR